MTCLNVNLLSHEQLAALGLTEQEVERVLQMRPIASILDLLFVDDIRAAAVQGLIAQGVLAGVRDGDLLQVGGLIFAAPRLVAFTDDDEEDDDKGDEDGGASFEVLSDNHFYEVEPAGKTTVLVIPDCKKKEKIVIKAYGSASRILEPGVDREAVEREAKDLAELALVTGIGRVTTKSTCQDKDGQGCKKVSVTLLKRGLTELFSLPRKKRQGAIQKPGWRARYEARAELEVFCR